MDTEGTEVRSPKGLQILEHAFSEGGKVLEFTENEDGERYVLDVTDHYEKLQEQSTESGEPSGEQL